MSHTISMTSRVRYEGRVQTFDRRAKKGADLEKIPDPIWRMVSSALRTHAHLTARTAEKSAEQK